MKMRQIEKSPGWRRIGGILAAGICLPLLLAGGGCGGGVDSERSPAQKAADARLAALEEDTTKVERAIAAFNTAFDAKDAESLRPLFTQMAEFYLEDGRALKAEEFIDGLPEMWTGLTDLKTDYRIEAVSLAGRYGWAKYTESFSFVADGEAKTMDNLVTMTFERRGKEWLIGHFHISSASRLPGA
jgi:ketosteroid isomerase-like protein